MKYKLNFMKKSLKVLSIIFATTICLVLLCGWSKPPSPRTFCFYVNSKCPVRNIDISITPYHKSIPYAPPEEAIAVSGYVENVSKGLCVEGKQIGIFKDTYYSYSVIDYLKAQGINNPTQAQIYGVTEQQLRDWFNRKHTTRRPWPWNNVPPKDVKVEEKFERKGPCRVLPVGYFFRIEGNIFFENGKICAVAPKGLRDLYAGAVVNGRTIISLDAPNGCPACNMY